MTIIKIFLILNLLFYFYADVTYAVEQTTESVLETFRAMSNAPKLGQHETPIFKKSNLTRNDVEKFLLKMRKGKNPINIPESLGTNLAGLDLSGLDFSNTIMYKVNLEKAKLDDCEFINTFLEGAIFRDTSLKRTKFTNTNLGGADFTKANLQGSYFSNCFAQNTLFASSNLEGSKIVKTNFSNSHFNNANFTGSKIIGSKLHIPLLVTLKA